MSGPPGRDNTGQRIMNKAHPFASALYIGTGFAHINRVANVARFIWVNMKIQPVVEGPNFNKLQATSFKLDNEQG